jgi:hypothetical protein
VVANRHLVTVSLDLFTNPSVGFTLPLFVVIIAVAIAGVAGGSESGSGSGIGAPAPAGPMRGRRGAAGRLSAGAMMPRATIQSAFPPQGVADMAPGADKAGATL